MKIDERTRLAREIRRANGGQLNEAGEALLAAFVADDKSTEQDLRSKLSGISINQQQREGGNQTASVASIRQTPKASD